MSRSVPIATTLGFFVGLLIGVSPGCWNSASKVVTGQVSGKVTLEGEPVKGGCLVHFVSRETGQVAGVGIIKEDGHFVALSERTPGLPVGEYAIQILPPPQDKAQEEEERKKVMGAVIGAVANKTKNPVIPPFSQEEVVPSKYWSDATSTLTFKVQEGDNSAAFELTKSKKK
jgi:hypothetical protein